MAHNPQLLLRGPVVPRESDIRAVVFGGFLGNPPPDLRLLYRGGAELIERMFQQGEISVDDTPRALEAHARLSRLAERATP